MGSQPIVLFVDDEEEVLNSIKRVLHRKDYKLLFATSGNAALEILEKEKVWVIVTDLLMPGMDGISLLKIVKKRYPHTVRIIATGVSDVGGVLYAVRTGETHRYITKPLSIKDELEPILTQALELYDLRGSKERLLKELEETNQLLKNRNEEIRYLRQIESDLNSERETEITGIITIADGFIKGSENLVKRLAEKSMPGEEIGDYFVKLEEFRKAIQRLNLYFGDLDMKI